MFHCQLCDYQTNERSSIHYHHIQPKECGGCNQKKNRVYFCPNCHIKIFCSLTESGIHSILKEDSIEIVGWFSSTGGRVLQYMQNNQENFVEDKNI